jgi:hypothetical protein
MLLSSLEFMMIVVLYCFSCQKCESKCNLSMNLSLCLLCKLLNYSYDFTSTLFIVQIDFNDLSVVGVCCMSTFLRNR